MARRKKNSLGIKFSALSLEVLQQLLLETRREIKLRKNRILKVEESKNSFEKTEGSILNPSESSGASDQETQISLPKRYYVHPIYRELAWNGRGKEPAWFKELIDSGYKAESLVTFG